MKNPISAVSIYNGILLGTRRVSLFKEELNLANKFPVPDSDTGDNLHYQMSRIRNNLQYNEDINHLLSSTSEIAILNSRGNSGAIFSQFFAGFEKNIPSGDTIELNDLVNCFKNGYEFSLKSISNPVTDGTILVAIKTWSESLEKNVNKSISMEDLYKVCIKELKKVVDNSKYVLKEQRQSNYSDAGASAFLYFVEGFMSAIVYNKEDESDREEVREISSLDAHGTDAFTLSKYRFCTEILLKKNNRTALDKYDFEQLGDSLVVSENKKYVKIHVHTDKPQKLTRAAVKYGTVIESKCDDMKIQSISGNIGDTALLIDSIADIPESFYTSDTYMIPLNLLVDNVTFKDKQTIISEMLYQSKASSSQPNSEDLRFVITKLLKSYDNVIILTVSSKMSGLYHQYKKIVDEFDNKNLYLVDTKLNSVAEGLVVNRAIEMVKQKLPIAEIVSDLEKTIQNTTILVSLKTINRMIASGRLNSKLGRALKWINFLPIITIDDKGEGKIYNFSFSEKKNKNLMIKNLRRNADKIAYYSVVHCECLEDAKAYAKKIEAELGYPPLYITDISHVVQNFSGKGSIAVGYTLKT